MVVTVKQVSPLVDAKRKALMETINGLSEKQVNNLSKLVSSEKALKLLENDFKVKLIL